MNVFLTFDIEVWCNGWDRLDQSFPAAFERYIYGRSRHGDYALPKTLEVLNRHGLHGVFFVEPLFSARFGPQFLERVVSLIRDAGQEVQLHLHPEWTDEISPPLLDDVSRKRQHLSYYSPDEQVRLIGIAKGLLEAAGSGRLSAFRAGSYAANRSTYKALHRNGIHLDSSLNSCFAISGADLREAHSFAAAFEIDGVLTFPVSVFKDGLGRARPAQVGACGLAEFRDVLYDAKALGWRDFVIVSHNFELLRVDSSLPDHIVANRFEKLCAFLAAHADTFNVTGFNGAALHRPPVHEPQRPRAALLSTAQRYAEQLLRRVH